MENKRVGGRGQGRWMAVLPAPCSLPHQHFRPLLDKRRQSRDFLGDGDGAAVGAGAFGTDVDDVRAVAQHLLRLRQGGRHVQRSVTAEGIVVDVDDAHDQRAAGEGKEVGAAVEKHVE